MIPWDKVAEWPDLSHFAIVTFILAVAYFGTLVSATNLLLKISKYLSKWQTQWIFYLGVVVHLIVRTVTWSIFCWVLMTQEENWQAFMLILMSLPEFIFLSTYLLLLFHWLEVYIFSKEQFLFATKRSFHKQWQRVFAGSHIAFYTGLVAFYAIFLTSAIEKESVIRYIEALSILEAVANFALPVAHIFVWMHFGIRLAGFSYSSENAKKNVESMNGIIILWSAGRLAKGTMLIVQNFMSFKKALSPVAYSMLMVIALLLTEFLPFIFALDYGIIGALIGEEAYRLSPNSANRRTHPQM
ncbi:hypothetical protein AAMO2058_001105000 [Amorphochlora amoebiformis]|mmetsp:Transcript_27034/g.42911  ORF Transcript_27034/g.42911 Transcript_27034/m.42911 type:complete len:299 (-) Transcript_27034:572-1468(-)